jgi:Chaperone for flagella basal body P-ring formation
MTNCSRLCFIGMLFVCAAQFAIANASVRVLCFGTPQAAVDAAFSGYLSTPTLDGGGYRVTTIQLDSVLGRRWATVTNCGHPHWPSLVLSAPGKQKLPTFQEQPREISQGQAELLVRAGDGVRLWRQEGVVRIEIHGVSEENGRLGGTIRVRLSANDTNEGRISDYLNGVVRGRSDVELLP